MERRAGSSGAAGRNDRAHGCPVASATGGTPPSCPPVCCLNGSPASLKSSKILIRNHFKREDVRKKVTPERGTKLKPPLIMSINTANMQSTYYAPDTVGSTDVCRAVPS